MLINFSAVTIDLSIEEIDTLAWEIDVATMEMNGPIGNDIFNLSWVSGLINDMNMSYESLSFDSTFFITIFSSIFFITLFGFILHIQVTEGQKQEMLRIKREVFRDKPEADNRNGDDLLYFKLCYQYGSNNVNRKNWHMYSSRWDKASLSSSEEWRIFLALRNAQAMGQLNKYGYAIFLPRKQIKTLDNKPALSSPVLISIIWEFERKNR